MLIAKFVLFFAALAAMIICGASAAKVTAWMCRLWIMKERPARLVIVIMYAVEVCMIFSTALAVFVLCHFDTEVQRMEADLTLLALLSVYCITSQRIFYRALQPYRSVL